jgi:Reverse transcriptase (RNA-dependent DNA polymerase)
VSDMKASKPIQMAFNWEAGVKPRGPGARGDSLAAREPTERPIVDENVMEEVVERHNMQAALKQVRANKGSPGVDGMSVDELPDFLKSHWPEIRDQLLSGTYQPLVIKRVEIPKPGSQEKRKLGIPCVLDWLIQQAILQVLQWRFDPTFSEFSYGFRSGRSAHQAIAQAQAYIEQGYDVVVDIDLEKFFDQVCHDRLMSRLAERIADKRLLNSSVPIYKPGFSKTVWSRHPRRVRHKGRRFHPSFPMWFWMSWIRSLRPADTGFVATLMIAISMCAASERVSE